MEVGTSRIIAESEYFDRKTPSRPSSPPSLQNYSVLRWKVMLPTGDYIHGRCAKAIWTLDVHKVVDATSRRKR